MPSQGVTGGSEQSRFTRRQVLRAGAAAGLLAGAQTLLEPARVLERALATTATCGALDEIEHVVIFINENRSFDSYYGTYRGVRGFGDKRALVLPDGSGKTVFAQPFPGEAGEPYGGHLLPFHFDTKAGGECVNDITHSWGPMHEAWDGGALDGFLRVHLEANGLRDGPNTMGYYTREDLPFYHALADNFTLCDHYHCSVLGPTDPNRCYTMTGTIDPDGKHGGPCLETLVSNRAEQYGKFTWPTYPEQLEAAGISWKVYGTPDGDFGDNVLPYFKAYQENPSLLAKALTATITEFVADCAAGTLPQVSWILASLVESEHPPAPVSYGEVALAEVLNALTSNTAIWERTALFATYDENGGFFDHVPPPVPPAGTAGEYLTVDPLPAAASGIRGPIGLGFRVPMLVISPFTRGGLVCSHPFDHTSVLRFLERRFGPPVPNLSRWRKGHTGDMTAAFNFAVGPDNAVPTLPTPTLADPRVLDSDCPTQAPDTGSAEFPTVQGYPLPAPPQTMPKQEKGSAKRPSGC
ncbi:MAG TPA: alkaline phosphatase family protein [Solirubrobacteraceae bacterium]|nr:alkaline phosphatase family protein [Solirubrobacteraceae bacterium]